MSCFPDGEGGYLTVWPFPSPRGDELFRTFTMRITRAAISFRPLAGMSCFLYARKFIQKENGFRPLAGMSCFMPLFALLKLSVLFPSPRGDELFQRGEK